MCLDKFFLSEFFFLSGQKKAASWLIMLLMMSNMVPASGHPLDHCDHKEETLHKRFSLNMTLFRRFLLRAVDSPHLSSTELAPKNPQPGGDSHRSGGCKRPPKPSSNFYCISCNFGVQRDIQCSGASKLPDNPKQMV